MILTKELVVNCRRIHGPIAWLAVLLTAGLANAATMTIDESATLGPFPLHWKGLADAMGHLTIPEQLPICTACYDSTIADWGLADDGSYFRMTIKSDRVRELMPDTCDWGPGDWNWDNPTLPIDQWIDRYDADGSIPIIFHVCCGYPLWLIPPEHQDQLTYDDVTYSWLEGDVMLPVFDGSVEEGLARWSGLITHFCDHMHEKGLSISLTVLPEPNIRSHWYPDSLYTDPERWDYANQYYEAFVAGVDSSAYGRAAAVGGLTWSIHGNVDISGIMDWARCWRDFCDSTGVRRDFVSYHHYWRNPDDFSMISDSLAAVFPGEELRLTEWNYAFKGYPPSWEYENRVIGVKGAVGNLSFVDDALEDDRHGAMTFFCVIGKYGGYGVCHWNDIAEPDTIVWDYTASGQALAWLAGFHGSELAIQTDAERVRARAAADNGRVRVLFWNRWAEPETVDVQVQLAYPGYEYTISVLDSLHTIEVPYEKKYGPVTYRDTLDMPIAYVLENGSSPGSVLSREMPIGGFEVWYLDIIEGTSGVADNPPAGGDQARLVGLSPNPCTDKTTVSYWLGTTSSIRLRVLDVAGRVARSVELPPMAPGAHCLTWDGRDDAGKEVASGVYMIELLAGDQVAGRKKIAVLR